MIIERTNYTWTASAVLGVYHVSSSVLSAEDLNVTHEKCSSGRDGLIFRLYHLGDLVSLDKYYFPSSCCVASAIDVILKTIYGIKQYTLIDGFSNA